MSVFVPYEQEVVAQLATPILGERVVLEVISEAERVDQDHTSIGYFLRVRHSSLPAERVVLDKPHVGGRLGRLEIGFVAFAQEHELTLECHSYGDAQVPRDIREGNLSLIIRPKRHL